MDIISDFTGEMIGGMLMRPAQTVGFWLLSAAAVQVANAPYRYATSSPEGRVGVAAARAEGEGGISPGWRRWQGLLVLP
jgi:hypothetical protein